jgi:hypothetical protein
MNAKDVIRSTIATAHELLTTYVSDLTDAELMTRPAPEANHVAWQLGHLIASEHQMLSDAGFTMPDLPEGLAEAHSKEAATSSEPAKFSTKQEYLRWMGEQRTATLNHLAAVADADLDKPTPEPIRSYAPTVGALFNIIGIHELMHAGQFAPVRRKLNKPILI